MKYLKNKSNGALFPWNPDHADRPEFEIYETDPVETVEKRIEEAPVVDPTKKDRRPYRRRTTITEKIHQ